LLRLLRLLPWWWWFGLVGIATDSQAALKSLHNLAQGGHPRSGIERRIKDSLAGREVGALWVRSHIGIPGNEEADRLAALAGHHGDANNLPEIVTYEGLKAKSRARRAATRSAPGFGKHRTDWGRHALSAYTWTRTNKGPQRGWLHHIGKAALPTCQCGHPNQNGAHLVFHCPLTAELRARLLPEGADSWETLDEPHWISEPGGRGRDEERTEGVESFFQDLYWRLRRGARIQEGEE